MLHEALRSVQKKAGRPVASENLTGSQRKMTTEEGYTKGKKRDTLFSGDSMPVIG